MLSPTTLSSTMVMAQPASAELRWEIVAMCIDLIQTRDRSKKAM